MRTVESIIELVYGNRAEAARQLGVGTSAVWNWKAWGCFPARLASPIFQHARAKGVEIDISEIPLTETAPARATDAAE